MILPYFRPQRGRRVAANVALQKANRCALAALISPSLGRSGSLKITYAVQRSQATGNATSAKQAGGACCPLRPKFEKKKVFFSSQKLGSFLPLHLFHVFENT